jgi:hypothetical protein
LSEAQGVASTTRSSVAMSILSISIIASIARVARLHPKKFHFVHSRLAILKGWQSYSPGLDPQRGVYPGFTKTLKGLNQFYSTSRAAIVYSSIINRTPSMARNGHST